MVSPNSFYHNTFKRNYNTQLYLEILFFMPLLMVTICKVYIIFILLYKREELKVVLWFDRFLNHQNRLGNTYLWWWIQTGTGKACQKTNHVIYKKAVTYLRLTLIIRFTSKRQKCKLDKEECPISRMKWWTH